jgi:hypothetical protein
MQPPGAICETLCGAIDAPQLWSAKIRAVTTNAAAVPLRLAGISSDYTALMLSSLEFLHNRGNKCQVLYVCWVFLI